MTSRRTRRGRGPLEPSTSKIQASMTSSPSIVRSRSREVAKVNRSLCHLEQRQPVKVAGYAFDNTAQAVKPRGQCRAADTGGGCPPPTPGLGGVPSCCSPNASARQMPATPSAPLGAWSRRAVAGRALNRPNRPLGPANLATFPQRRPSDQCCPRHRAHPLPQGPAELSPAEPLRALGDVSVPLRPRRSPMPHRMPTAIAEVGFARLRARRALRSSETRTRTRWLRARFVSAVRSCRSAFVSPWADLVQPSRGKTRNTPPS
jgi:hypothetical protein